MCCVRSVTNTTVTANINMAAGTHTIDLRTARQSGNTNVNIGGDAAISTLAAEMHITVYIF